MEKLELWKAHCLRDFTDIRRGITDGSLSPPESWRKLYQSKEDEIAEKEAKLSQRLKSIREEQQMAKNAKTAKVIEDPRMRKEAIAQSIYPRLHFVCVIYS